MVCQLCEGIGQAFGAGAFGMSEFSLGFMCGVGSTFAFIGVLALLFIAGDRIAWRISMRKPSCKK